MTYVATKADSREAYLQSSVRIMDIAGRQGAKPPPFDSRQAIEQFQSWCYIAAMINARQLESVPLRLFVRSKPKMGPGRLAWQTRKLDRRSKAYLAGDLDHRPSKSVTRKILEFGLDDFEEVTDRHPITDLLRMVNPWANGFETGLLKWVYLQMTGNSYQHIVLGDDGLPAELWTMPSQWTRIIPGGSNEFIGGYIYGAGTEVESKFETDEVIHYKLPNPSDLWYGKGFMEAAWSAWTLETSNRQRDLAQERNMGRPDYLLICKPGTTSEALDRFEKMVQRKLRGAKNAGNILTLTGDAELAPLAMPDVSLGSADKIVEEIGGAFGVPVSMLKANFHVAGGQAEVSDVHWLRNTIAPLLQVDEEKLNERLVEGMFGLDDAVLAYDNVVPEDKIFERDKAVALTGAGIETLNEARRDQMLEPSDDPLADSLLINGQPLGASAPVFNLPFQSPAAQIEEPAEPVPAPQIEEPAEPEPEPEPVPVEPQGDEVASESVLNGAQITAATGIVMQVAEGLMPRDAGIGQLQVLFNLSLEKAEMIMGSAGTGTATTPNVVEAHHAEPDAEQGQEPAAVASRSTVPATCGGGKIVSQAEMVWKQADPAIGPAEDTQRDDEQASKISLMQAAIQEVLDRFGGIVAQRIGSTRQHRPRVKLRNTDIEAIISQINRDFEQIFIDEVRGPMAEIIAVGGNAGVAQLAEGGLFDGVFDVTNPAVDAFISSHTIELAGNVRATTLSQVQRVLTEGMAAGASPQTLAQQINEAGMFGSARSEAIARTESALAYVEGEKVGWQESGVVAGMKWLLAPNPCEFCLALSKQFKNRTVGLSDSFISAGPNVVLQGARGGKMKIDFRDIKGPPLHPNCRCDLIAVPN